MQSEKSLLLSKKHSNIKPHNCPAPLAVMDIGTNTIRLLIGSISNGTLIRIVSERIVSRLGGDMLKTGMLSTDSIEKSVISIIKLKELCEKHRVQDIIAIGTCALREAKNRDEFLARVKKAANLDIEIISGKKEAELTLKGLLWSGLKNELEKKEPQTFFIVDIGGGSTEWILYSEDRRHPFNKLRIENRCQKTGDRMDSIPIGAVKLFDIFIKHDPPLSDELKEMKGYIFKELSNSLNPSLISYIPTLNLIATGGTATTIAAIDTGMDKYNGDKIHMHKISLSALRHIYEKLIHLPLFERSKIKGLEPERADIIIPGTLILLTIMEVLNVEKITISDYGLLEGAMISYLVV